MNNSITILPRWVIILFFLIGACSAVIFRIILILSSVSPEYVKLFWYMGALGYVFFFSFRFFISLKRKRAVREYRLIEKIDSGEPLSSDERRAVSYLLGSIDKSLENYNYVIIFASTFIAIAADIAITVMK